MTMRGAELLDALSDLLTERVRSKATGFPSGTPQGPYIHGPGGLFSTAGIERQIISTRVQPRGLASVLPGRGTVDMYPLFGYVTGFQNVTGSNPNGVCDDPMTAGAIKGCLQTAQFGRYSFQTRELELNRLGQRTNRGEFLDLTLLNNPLVSGMGDMVTPNTPGNLDFNNEVAARFMEVGVAFQNALVPDVYSGNPANNTAGGGYAEFPGLDILIGTNKYDAITGVRCPSLDSDIKNFNYSNVNNGDTGDIVNVVTYLFRYLRNNADRMGFNPVRWVITMRQTLFWELTALWPCSYLTYRCAFRDSDGQARVNVDAGDQIAMRDDMRQGSYLLIDGERVEVIIDDGITEYSNTTSNRVPNASFSSDIYFIPMTVRGGLAVTYWEYLDYSRGAMPGAQEGMYAPGDFWTDGGRYLWHKKPSINWCVQWLAKIEPRLIFLTPQLAGRITNVVYTPLQHERTPFPADPYFVNGGVSTARQTPSFYSDWRGH